MRVDLSGSGHYEYELKSNISLRMSKPRYTALSYPWGDKHRRKHIEVDGCVLSISRNLYYALKAVKESWKSVGIMEEERYVWIDQVCIDQKHDAEKNHQVAFMGNMYEMAEQVVIWLPVPMRIRSNFNTWQTWRDWHLRHSSQHQWLHDFGTLTRSMKDAKAAHRGIAPGQEKSLLAWRNANCIVESSWWNRAWVYQEFMLSTRAIFLLDGMTIPWLDLHQFLGDFYSRLPLHAADCEEAITELGLQESRLQAVGSEKTSVWKRLSRRGRLVLGILRMDEHEARSSLFDVRRQMRELDTYNQERAKAEMAWKLASFVMRSRANRSDSLGRSFQPLSTLMDHGRNCNSADPRDKVFAFLGLADPRYNIVADYRESRTSNALLTEVAARIIIIEQRLDILAIAMDDRNNIYHGDDVLPTWVPNWSRAHNPNSEYKMFLRQIGFPLANDCNPRPCRASMDVQPQVAILPDRYGNPGRVLCARAIFVATLGKMVKDDHAQPWRLFKSKDTELRITASHLARPGDEVFVILGADEPFVLSRHPGTQFCYLRGHAMLWEQELPSPILQGYMIGELQRRKVSVETVYIS
ncbi:hypothetical protein CKM354_000199900 [Cercospora kikuchii]|uniref:Heterokaryon incompatibility domain-containing protein n=1 Tax=Cercospora kikuchii TaxID=84275 RepID=A0A9P3CBN5_9PEZI|nr:uncharacterized protein CKM354_000199900 [Cercospora kikuchii]GIZ38586.1 hypothetical protein CKM354_000199900 [Cercospora kikuchii]